MRTCSMLIFRGVNIMPPCIDSKLFIWPGLPGARCSQEFCNRSDFVMVFEDLSKKQKTMEETLETFNALCWLEEIWVHLQKLSKFNAWVPWNVEIHLWIFYDSGDAGQFQWTRCLNQHYAVSKPLFVGIPFLISKPSKQHQLVEPSSFKTYAHIKLDHATLLMVQKSQGQPPGWMYKTWKNITGIFTVSAGEFTGFLPSKEQEIRPDISAGARHCGMHGPPVFSSRRTQKWHLNMWCPKRKVQILFEALSQKKICNISDVIFKMSFKTYLGQQKQSHFLMILCCISKAAKFWVSAPEFHLFASFFSKTGSLDLFFAIFSAIFDRRVLSSLDVIMPNMEIAPYYISATTFFLPNISTKGFAKAPSADNWSKKTARIIDTTHTGN